jgi:hypothetical protein
MRAYEDGQGASAGRSTGAPTDRDASATTSLASQSRHAIELAEATVTKRPARRDLAREDPVGSFDGAAWQPDAAAPRSPRPWHGHHGRVTPGTEGRARGSGRAKTTTPPAGCPRPAHARAGNPQVSQPDELPRPTRLPARDAGEATLSWMQSLVTGLGRPHLQLSETLREAYDRGPAACSLRARMPRNVPSAPTPIRHPE